MCFQSLESVIPWDRKYNRNCRLFGMCSTAGWLSASKLYTSMGNIFFACLMEKWGYGRFVSDFVKISRVVKFYATDDFKIPGDLDQRCFGKIYLTMEYYK